MKWRRILVALVALVLIVAIGAAGALLWVIRTDSGTGWLIRQIAARAGSVLEIDAVSGTLLDGISVTGVHVVLGDAELDIDRARVRASLSELIARRLVVYELAAGTVRYTQAGASGGNLSNGGIELELPVAIEIRRISLDSIEVATPLTEIAFGSTSFAGVLDDARLRLIDLRTSTRGFSIEANGSLLLQAQLELAADFSWSTEIDGIAWSGSGRTAGTPADLEFEHRLDTPFTLLADGDLRLGDTPRARVALRWEDLGWPGFDLARSPSGSAELSGWLDGIEFAGAGQAVVQDIGVAFTARGRATPQTISFAELAVDSELGRADISGDVELDSISWNVNVAAAELDPSRFIDGWPGELTAEGRVRGALEPGLRWSVNDLEIAGRLRDLPVAGGGNVASNGPGEWRLDGIELDWGGNRASVSGDIGTALDALVHIDAPELSAFLAGLSGHLTLDGRLGGSVDSPAFVGNAAIDGAAIANLSVDRLSLEGSVSALEEAELALRFQAEGIRTDRPIVEKVSGRIDGTTAAHTAEVVLEPEIGAGSLSVTGGWRGDAWSGVIRSAELDQDLLGRWTLAESADLSFSAGSIALGRACLTRLPARLCVVAELGSDDNRIDLTVDSFDVAWLEPLIAEPVTVTGLLDAALSLRGPLTRPRGTLSLRGESSLIKINDVQAPLEIPINGISIDAELTESQLEATAAFRTAADASIDIAGTLNEIWTPAPRIDARIDGTWANVGILSLLSPDIGEVSGAASLSIALSGPLEAPDVQGEARWIDGAIAVPRWGLVVDDVDVRVSSANGTELIYAMSANAGDGTIELTGQTEFDPDAGFPTSFTVHGENVPAVQRPEAQVVVSPDLEVFTAWPVVNVVGTVAVPRATLSLDQMPSQSNVVSPDVVVHGTASEAPQRPLTVFADLHLILGDDVRFTGSGLDGRLGGQIDVEYRSGRPTFANGSLSLAGEYMTFAQTLELDQGQLLFGGQLTNPTLDVRAIRRFETEGGGEVDAGVVVTGTVRQPVTRLYSDPSMSDGDIISYLVIGRPLSDSSRENSEALQTAALSMGITQAIPQIQHFGEVIGLDELGLRTSEANTGELMAGKQVSPRMYMRYTYGLINRVGGLLLRFRLTDHLNLETRTGDNKGMDLLYMIERE